MSAHFHSALRRCVKVPHLNLYTFLGNLQRATADSETDVARLNRGMSIRRSKKRTNLVSSPALHVTTAVGAYTRVQFLRAVSHSVGAHAVPADATDDSDIDDDDDQVVNGSNQPQSLGPVSAPPSQDMCQVCLIEHNLRLCRAGIGDSVRRASPS